MTLFGNKFAPRPIFRVGLFIHHLGLFLMGYRWGQDLWAAGADSSRECASWIPCDNCGTFPKPRDT